MVPARSILGGLVLTSCLSPLLAACGPHRTGPKSPDPAARSENAVSGVAPADDPSLPPGDLAPYFSDPEGQQAVEALLDNDLPEALRLFEAIAEGVSDIVLTPRARFMAAYLAERLGDNRRALRELPALAGELPLLADLARLRAASAALALGDRQAAIDLASQVDRSGGSAPEAAAIEARARGATPAPEPSEAAEREIPGAAREKRAALAAYAKAVELLDKMQNREAERAFGRVARLARAGESLACRAQYYEAVAIARQRDWARAAALFDRVAEACGEPFVKVRALFKGGTAYQSAERCEDAIRLFDAVETSFAAHSFADDARLHAAQCYLALGESGRFNELLLSLLELYPQGDMGGEAMWLLAREAINRGDRVAARDLLARYYLRFPKETAPHAAGRAGYWLGRAEELLGSRENAQIRYEQVIAGFPLAFYAVLSYGRLLEIDPKRAAELMAELAPTPGTGPALRVPKALVRDFRPLAVGIELERLGLFPEAARELARLRGRPDLPPDLLCVTAALLRRAGGASSWQERYPAGDDAAFWRQAYPRAFEEEVLEAAEEHGVAPELIWAVMREESGFDPAIESWANAIGLMQLLLPTARSLGQAAGLRVNRRTLRDPGVNIALGAAYLKALADRFAGHPALVIAAYNAGEGAVEKWLADPGLGGSDLDLFIENIPYEQTRRYTKRVLASMAAYRFLYGQGTDLLTFDLSRPFAEAIPGRGPGKTVRWTSP